MTGADLVAHIRSQPALAGVRLVLISGLPPPSGPSGVDAVLQKPFGVERLIGTVRAQLPAP